MRKYILILSAALLLASSALFAQCIDMSNLYSSNIICTYGTFNNPYQYTGVYNGRHTVMTNPNARDGVVNALFTVPPGEARSIRLGDNRNGAQAESITFLYTVDPVNTILVLKYAAVMEDPSHPLAEQPRLKLEVLNTAGQLINPECTSFEFIANASLGWNSINNGRILWKDWTTVGVDLSAYVGQTIRIRLTNYDCSHGGHYAYAYFHLSCTQKDIEAKACGAISRVSFSAPAGFEYNWYYYDEDSTRVTVSTSQNVSVAPDGTAYYCEVSQIGKPECSYTTSVVAHPRYPLADFDIDQREACTDTLYLTNTSGISSDGINKNNPLEPCESAFWDLGDGRTFNQYDISRIPITYATSGIHNITLIVSLNGGECTDTIVKSVYVHGYNDPHVGVVYDTICSNSSYSFNGSDLKNAGDYVMHTTTSYGCDSTTILHLTVLPAFLQSDIQYICTDDTLTFQGRTITKAGVYYANYTNIHGCDSVYKLTVLDAPKYFHELEATICDNEHYDFNGRLLNEEGIYIDSLHSIYGCDSVVQLTLHVSKTYLIDRLVETCHSDTFIFRNRVITEPGIYYDTLLTHSACDSVFRFIYNKTPEFLFEAEATILQGDSFLFHGNYYSAPGLHTITYQTTSGCDSIYQLNLTVLPQYFFHEEATVCDSTPYEWHGHIYYKSGTYYDSLKTVLGHDSIYELELTVNKSYVTSVYVESCHGENFNFRGRSISEPGIYYDTLLTHEGCDSIIKLVYNVVPTYHFVDTAYFCRGGSYNYRGNNLTSPGVYYDSLRTNAGCDSIYELRLFEMPTFYNEITETICDNESYSFNGRVLRTPGVYYDSLTTSFGCDSIIKLTLNVNPTYLIERYVELCHHDTLTYRDMTITEPGVYYDSLISSTGCDSVYRLIYNVNPIYSFETEMSIYKGDSVLFEGNYYSTAGTHVVTYTTESGCDSVYKLHLNIIPNYFFTENVTTCDDEPYFWHGHYYYTSGIFYDSLKSSLGHDSVYVLTLTVNPTYETPIYVTTCSGEDFNFRGRLISESGVYYDTLFTKNGCDSVIKLIYNIVPTYHFIDSAYICRGGSYSYRGHDYNVGGVYFDSLKTDNGCDSIYELRLFEVPTFYQEISETICDNETYNFNGRILNTAGVYYDSLITKTGCDSVIKLTLTVNPTYIIDQYIELCHNDTFYFRNLVITEPGVYYDSLLTQTGCDSVYRLVFSVTPVFAVETAETILQGDSILFEGSYYSTPGMHVVTYKTASGCDSVYKLNLTVLPRYFFTESYTTCASDPYLWHGHYYYSSGVYYDSLKTSLGHDSIYELNLTVNPTYETPIYVTTCSGEDFNFRGRLISESGVYYDTLFTKNGCDSVIKLIYNIVPTYHFIDSAYICRGGSYSYRGHDYNVGGVYFDSLKTDNGCDSIYELRLFEVPTFYQEISETICDNETYNFNGRILNTAGVYYDSLITKAGCDSIIKLTLTVNPTYIIDQYIELCHNDTFYFRNLVITEPGVYYDSLLTQTGCDSVYRLVFSVTPVFAVESAETILQGDSILFEGSYYSTPGMHVVTYKTSSGCDSVYKLNLTVLPRYFFTESYTTCESDPYLWHGHYYYSSGVYYDSLKTSLGHDSIYELVLTVNPTYETPIYVTTCSGEDFNFRGRLIYESGVYYDTLYTSAGCDSVIKLVYNIVPTYHFIDSAYICRGGSYSYRGHDYNVGGVYFDSLKTDNGCDSIYELRLFEVPTFYQEISETICDNETYNFNGRILNTAGVYYDSLITKSGCDSVIKLTLTVNPTYIIDQYIELCHNDTFYFRNLVITEPGVYYDSLLTQTGCDSVYRLVFSVTPVFAVETAETILQGDSILFEGSYYSTPGLHVVTYKTSSGCDSVYKLNLTVLPRYFFTESYTTCESDPYLWHGHYYYSSGTYYDSLKTSLGHDSIYELNLTVNPTYETPVYVTTCSGEDFNFRGRLISESGVYYDTLFTSAGCDSVIKLIYNIVPTYHFIDSAYICRGGSYSYRGHDYNVGGVYFDSLKTDNGCDSIYELRLFEVPTFYQEISETICDNETYNFNGRILNTAGVYYDSLITKAGCDSVIKLTLTVNPTYIIDQYIELCHNDTFYFRNLVITEPGVYYDSLLSQTGCDSVYRLVFSVTPVFAVETAETILQGDSILFEGSYYSTPGLHVVTYKTSSGCDSVYKLNLTVLPRYFFTESYTTCESDPYLWHGHYYYSSGTYYDSLKTSLGHDSIYELVLTINPTYETPIYVTTCSGEDFNFRGRLISESGVYYDTLFTKNGCDSVIKLIYNIVPTYHFIDSAYICRGGSYSYRGHDYNVGGVYFDSLKTDNGCDSIYELRLFEVPTFYQEISETICDNETYNFNGRILNTAGVYYDSLITKSGCDSIIKLTLTVNPTYLIDRYIETCRTDTFLFRGHLIDHPGVFYDSLISKTGCDSVYRLIYNVTPDYQFDVEQTILEGDSFLFQGNYYSTAGLHIVTYRTTSNCDSVYRLTLHVIRKYEFVDNVTICDSLPYYWHGKYCGTTGTYYDSLRTVDGNDSVYVLHLTFNRSYVTPIYVSSCSGSSFNFHGRTISQTGIYYDTLYTTAGCDSVIKLIYTVHPHYHFSDTAYICHGGSYAWRGRTFTYPGTFIDSLTTTAGCDSIYELNLIEYPTFLQDDSVTICDNEPYQWHNRQISKSGLYIDTFHTVHGCDSIFRLHLTVLPSYLSHVYVTLCPNETYSIRGTILHAPCIYYDTIMSSHGCDSVTRYVLSVSPDFIDETTVSICPSDIYTWRGRQLNAPGTYADTFQTINGCDSIYRLVLRHNPSYEFVTIDSVICSNEPYTWRGKQYTQSGTYRDAFRTVDGCDSVYILRLYVSNYYHSYTRDSICDYQQYYWRGRYLTETGIYTDSLTTIGGCDSIFTIDFKVYETQRDTILRYLCIGDTFLFAGNALTQTGQYIDTTCAPYAGNCRITVLNLQVVAPIDLYYTKIPDVCADDTTFEVAFRYSGSQPIRYSLRYDDAAHAQGFEDLIDQDFDSIAIGRVPQYPGNRYVRPDYYNVHVEFDNGGCDPGQTGVDIQFRVRYPSWIIEQNWNDVIALLNENYNGGFIFDKYEWYVNGRKVDYAKGTNLFMTEIGIGDEIVLYPQREGENYSIPTCPLTVIDKSADEQYDAPVLVYPSSVRSSDTRVYIHTELTGRYIVYNILGTIVAQGEADEISDTPVDLPNTAGWYIMVFLSDNGQKGSVKIQVH